MTYTADDGTVYDSVDEYITAGLCGLCGCGSYDVEDDLIAVFMTAIPDEVGKMKTTSQPDDIDGRYYELLLKVLDAADLLEHGTSVFHSWLTPLGRSVARELIAEAG